MKIRKHRYLQLAVSFFQICFFSLSQGCVSLSQGCVSSYSFIQLFVLIGELTVLLVQICHNFVQTLNLGFCASIKIVI